MSGVRAKSERAEVWVRGGQNGVSFCGLAKSIQTFTKTVDVSHVYGIRAQVVSVT